MGIEILSAGLHTTIQDRGRFGYQHKGVPISGFMDVYSANLANLLVNNKKDNALIEMSLVGIKFKATKKITIAITGANMQPTLNKKPIEMYKAVIIYKGDIVNFQGSSNGVYSYMAIGGKINIQKILDSKATYTPANIGGYKGRILKKGDVINIKCNSLPKTNAKLKAKTFLNSVVLECLPGPEWEYFDKQSIDVFFNTEYSISNDSNRIGVRLNGLLIKMPEKNEIISSGIVKGTVQITKAGQPIVMMSDAPTTGGYMRLINLTQESCNILAQTQIGGKIKFQLK